MMKKIILFVLIPGLFLISCKEEENGKYLEVSANEISLDAAGTEQQITVQTNEFIWQLTGETDWVKIDRDSCFLLISAPSNPTRSPRTAKVVIVAGDRFERLLITQAGSSRMVGDPYPNEENPTGIIYKMTSGGEHGKVISLDYLTTALWGPTDELNNPGARSYSDGKSNTRYLIEAHKDQPDFETTHPIFSWIYEKNGRNLDGGWYLPSYYELRELQALLTGATFDIPATAPSIINQAVSHNIQVREQFNFWIRDWGGTPVEYGVIYWSSTEYSVTQADVVPLEHQRLGVMLYASKANTYAARAIYEF
jgi:hypothetical protein